MQSILRIEQRRSISLASLLTIEFTAPREMLRLCSMRRMLCMTTPPIPNTPHAQARPTTQHQKKRLPVSQEGEALFTMSLLVRYGKRMPR